MMQPHDFRYSLISAEDVWVLPQAPDGWEESTLQWARSAQYFGLIRTFSVPLRFVLDGAWLLRRLVYTGSVEAGLRLRIELLNRQTWQYDQILYEGDIDFTTMDDTMDAMEAQLMEASLSASVAAYANVDYEWEVTEADTVPVRLPGIDRVETAINTLIGSPLLPPAPPLPAQFANRYLPVTQVTTNEMATDYVTMGEQELELVVPAYDFTTSTNFWFECNTTTQLRINGSIEFTAYRNPFSTKYFTISLVDSTAPGGGNRVLLFTTVGTPGTGTVDIDVTVDLVVGRRYFLYCQAFNPSDLADTYERLEFVGVNFALSYGITTEPSVVRAYRPKAVFAKLIERMAGAGAEISSNLLDQWDNLLITSGDAIRDIEGATIKTKFDDFFKSINALLNVGFGIVDGKATIEAKDFWFRSVLQVLDLGDSVKDVHIFAAEEYMFNSIKAGYPNDDYEVDRGREEYNSTQIWSTPIQRMQKQIDLSSTYRADQYGIEQLRITVLDGGLDNVNEQDRKNDNEVFFVHAQKTPGEDGIFDVIGAENYTLIEGISTRSSSYNLEITPKKNLLRHSNYLSGALFNVPGNITFASAEKNANLVTVDINGRAVAERDPISIPSLGTPLFKPFRVEFTNKLPVNIWKTFDTGAMGYVRFEFRGNEFYGFILEGSQNIVRNAEQSFTLLLTNNSDLTKLIY